MTPDDAQAYYQPGAGLHHSPITLIQEKSYIDLCIADFNQSIALSPDQSESYFNRGICAARLKRIWPAH